MNQQSLLEPGEKPVFEWYKDGAPFNPEERFKCSFQVINSLTKDSIQEMSLSVYRISMLR